MEKMAVVYLLSLGHGNIGVVGGRRDKGDSLSLRYQGVLDAYEAAGLTFEESHYVESRFSFHGAYATAKDFFRRHPQVTALFAMSDTAAIGAIRALHDLHLQVPKDISVIGFDGISLGTYHLPSLTTVMQPVDALASESITLLQNMLEDPSYFAHQSLPAEFVIRESTSPLQSHHGKDGYHAP